MGIRFRHRRIVFHVCCWSGCRGLRGGKPPVFLARIKPRMEKFPLVGGSRLFADLAEGNRARPRTRNSASGRPGVYRTRGWRKALRRSYGLALVGKRAASRGTDFRRPRGGRRCGPHLVADLPGTGVPPCWKPGHMPRSSRGSCPVCRLFHDPFRLPLVNIAGVAFRGLPGYIVYWITVLQRSIS